MKLQEIERRLCILNGKEAPTINKRMLRGGMQERLRRQDIRRYGQDIKNQRADLITKKAETVKKLDLLDKRQKKRKQFSLLEREEDSDFSIIGVKEDAFSKFNEPKLKRIRNKRSFF